MRFVSKQIKTSYASTRLRTIQPAQYLKGAGYSVTVSWLYQSVPCKNEVDMLHRAYSDTYTEYFISYAKLLGNPVVYDTDDLLFDQEGINYLNRIGKTRKVGYEGFRTAMQKCDAITVSTSYLAERARALHGNVHVLRNALSKEYLEKAMLVAERKKAANNNLTIAYLSGSNSHDENFRLVQPALLELLERHVNCKVLLVGDLRFTDDFYKFTNRFEYRKTIAYEEYANLFSEIDINLIPLELNEPFCHAKSELKYIEAGACAVPSVASPTATYNEVIDDGVNGLLTKDNSDWYECIEALIVDTDKRRSLGAKAREYVLQNYTPEQRGSEWADFIETVWSEKTEKRTKHLSARFKLRIKLEAMRAYRVLRTSIGRLLRFQFS